MPEPMIKPDPARLVVPRRQGRVLIEPGGEVLAVALTQKAVGKQNRAREGAGADGVAWEEVRAVARADLVRQIQAHAADCGEALETWAGLVALDRPWVITGHQVEFYHAGVWAKVIAADALARATGACAIDLLVDHDELDHLGFDVPVQESDHWRRRSVTWATAGTGAAMESLLAPGLPVFEEWDAELARSPLAHSDALALVLAALRPREGGGRPEPYALWMSRARQRLEAALGIAVHHVRTSAMCESRAWHWFGLEWIRHGREWSDCYNRQLAAYRKRAGIHNPSQPMPDLQRTGEDQELPFWVYKLGEPRHRLTVRTSARGDALVYDEREIPIHGALAAQGWAAADQLREILVREQLVLRPRALTLTLFVRLFLADLFLHGIGGALYDQITDGILQEIWGGVPAYGCVSAAWLLGEISAGNGGGTAGDGAEQATPTELAHLRHHWVHNPQLALDVFTARQPALADLLAQRTALVERLTTAVRNARSEERLQRREWFDRLGQVNAAVHARYPTALTRLDAQIAAARRQVEDNKVRYWREYYVGIHSLESLGRLVATIRKGCAAGESAQGG